MSRIRGVLVLLVVSSYQRIGFPFSSFSVILLGRLLMLVTLYSCSALAMYSRNLLPTALMSV